ncbi:hypothetical protein KI387_030968, partial [Taxus chinensis]
MAQVLTSLHSSCGINPSCPFNSVHKLGPANYKVSCFSETRSSVGKAVSASPRLVSSKSLQRGIRCSASNSSGGQKGNVIEVQSGEELEKYIEDAGDKLVVVDISTTTCGPCKLVYPKVVKMSIEYPDTLFYKINGDKSTSTRDLMRKWGVRAVPNFRFYRRGKLLHSHSGAKEDELRAHFLTHYVGVQ